EKIKNTVDYKRIKNKDVCVVSGDMHSYGLYVISRVLEKLGANVVDGGNAMEALDTLDLADEYGINDICISLHNGQALAYAKLIKQLARDRKTNYRFFMGGQLTSFLNEDDTEPVDVTDQLQQMDIVTTETVEDLVKKLII
ncbi:MAG: cobalamin B12-binding domain-containing protein, partial [Clostridia bacterium]|nr:cobalamin B12-binding domain-containing protein [Clostridia bacterium]